MNSIQRAPSSKTLSILNEAHCGCEELSWIADFVSSASAFQNSLSNLKRETERLSNAFAEAAAVRPLRTDIKSQVEQFACDLQKLYRELLGAGCTGDHITNYIEGYDHQVIGLVDRARSLVKTLKGKR